MTSEINRRLVASFMQFLTDELNNSDLSGDSKESIEVALQCLESSYEINPVDGALPTKKPLLEIFTGYLKNNPDEGPKKSISPEEKAKADSFKNEGNELMKNEKYQEALDAYSKAIEIDNSNPIYYCNRAAAHQRLNNYTKVLDDCRMAIKNDPTYSKAYCRMGLAYIELHDYQRAYDSYKKAYELDPSENIKNNLTLAENALQEANAKMGGGLGGFEKFLNNPQIINMTKQILTNPNMQNMFSQMMSSAMDSEANSNSGEANQNENPSQADFSSFLQMGQQFAEQIRAANPEMIAQLQNLANQSKNENEEEKKNE